MQGQMRIAQFIDGLATQYGQLFKAFSNRLDAVEKEAFGPDYNQQPACEKSKPQCWVIYFGVWSSGGKATGRGSVAKQRHVNKRPFKCRGVD